MSSSRNLSMHRCNEARSLTLRTSVPLRVRCSNPARTAPGPSSSRFDLGAVHVAHHRKGWVLQNNLLQRFAYLEVSALHKARMVGAGDVKQRGATDAVFSSEAHRRLDFRAFARDDDLPGGIEIGDIDIGGGGECAHGRLVAADQRGHRAGSRLAGRFHETATLFDQEQTIFKGKGFSRGVRRPFA
jgi:hypothetical protein